MKIECVDANGNVVQRTTGIEDGACVPLMSGVVGVIIRQDFPSKVTSIVDWAKDRMPTVSCRYSGGGYAVIVHIKTDEQEIYCKNEHDAWAAMSELKDAFQEAKIPLVFDANLVGLDDWRKVQGLCSTKE